MIEMLHVCKTYRVAKRSAGFMEACRQLFHREHEQICALDDVSFTIRDGEIVSYMGPNGAGNPRQSRSSAASSHRIRAPA